MLTQLSLPGMQLQVPVSQHTHSTASEASIVFTKALSCRLRERLQTMGHNLYSLQWKDRYTPSGRLVPSLRGSVPGARGGQEDEDQSLSLFDACDALDNPACADGESIYPSGWPTPQVSDINASRTSNPQEYSQRYFARESHGSNLAHMAQAMTGWPTPVANAGNDVGWKATDGRNTPNKPGWAAELCGWTTPQCFDASGNGKPRALRFKKDGNRDPSKKGSYRGDLRDLAGLAGWPTPVAQPANGTPEAFLERKRKAVANGHKMGICVSDLNMASQFAGWPTPQANKNTKNSADPQKLKEGGVQTALADAAWIAGWPTPNAMEQCESLETVLERKKKIIEAGKKTPGLMKLGTTCQLAGWATPVVHDPCERLDTFMTRLYRNKEQNKPFIGQMKLGTECEVAGWSTPLSRDSKEDVNTENVSINGYLARQVWLSGPMRITSSGEVLCGDKANMEGGGKLNPAHSRWLMGYPHEWDEAAIAALPGKKDRKKAISEGTLSLL